MAEEDTRRADEHSERPRPEAGGRDSDPLAELARLIGQSDPFAELKRKPLERQAAAADAPPGWLARGPASAYDAYQAAEPASDAPNPADTASDRPSAEQTGERHDPADGRYRASDYDERYRVAMPSAEGDYYGAEMPDDDGDVPPPRRPAWLIPVVAVLGLAVVGTAGAFGYRALTGPSTPAAAPPVIKADTTPAKVAPAAQPADAQPKLFDRVGENQTTETRVVSREEQPVDINTRPRLVPPPPPTTAAPPTVPSISTAPTASVPPANSNEPKRVKTTTIRPAPADPAQPNAAPAAPNARAPLANPPARQPSTRSGPLALNPQSAEAPATPVRTARVAPSDGSYVVQVSAQKTESDAQASYRALQAKYPEVLGGREASIRRADLGDKGVYYRAHVGPFATANQAATFCENLKAAGGQCIVQRN